MKLAIYAILSIAILSSCSPDYDYEYPRPIYDNDSTISIFLNVDYRIITIDSCQYIIGRDDGPHNGGYFLTHKGNCTNHNQKK
jgi:hypothetical protein